MGDFSAAWLALREPADTRARRAALVGRLTDWLVRTRPPRLEVLDLGCGSGANLRYLAPRLAARLGVRQDWICVDRDPELLAALQRELEPSAPRDWQVRTLRLDLARGVPALPIAPGTLTVASALLDLVSEPWLRALLQTGAAAHSPMLLTLSYDGRATLKPQHPLDGIAIALANAHQLRDKGLGPALGPMAPIRLAELAAGLGYSVTLRRSDWKLQPGERAIQAALVEGWSAAALEQIGGTATVRWTAAIAGWREARLALIEHGHSRMRVGHRDALLLPRPDQVRSGCAEAKSRA